MRATRIVTHRGLDPSRENYFSESSREAFTDQLSRGYGLEFDVFEHEGSFIVAHDPNLKRITKNGHIIALHELGALIEEMQAPGAISALHLKSRVQGAGAIDRILDLFTVDASKFMIFDVTVETARYLKKKNPKLQLAPSVAHSFDIERYNPVTGGTLLPVEDVLAHRDLFDWVWLDEWDRRDTNGEKRFYTPEVFKLFRDVGLKIALVTPELHGTSPGLLGGEAHEDAKPFETLAGRLKEIASLHPDAICTDYPDFVKELL